MRRGLTFSLLSFILLMVPCLMADTQGDFQDKTRELEQIQTRIQAVKASLDAAETQKNSLLDQLSDIERRYGAIAQSLQLLDQEVKTRALRLQATRRDRDRQSALIREQHDALVGQIRAAHAMGRRERLRLILNQDEPARVSRLLVYHDYFNRARLSQIEQIAQELQALQRIENELLLETERLKQLQDRKRAEQAALDDARHKREGLLSRINRELSDQGEELKRLKDNEQRLQRLIASIQRALEGYPVDSGLGKPFLELRGELHWPVDGALLKRFASRRAAGRWDGVLIKAKEGTVVRAVAHGRVAYSDWLRGYGLLSIIDHGGGYMTLYAFNQSLFKDVGDWVEAGEAIATVGNSGGRARPGLYFEIRANGKPVNPVKWCRKKRQRNAG